MPFINSKVSVPVSKEKKEVIKAKLGQAAANILGKSENWLMVGFEDNYDLYFQGNQEAPSAFIEVKVFGTVSERASRQMTAVLCNLYEEELQIPKNRMYVKYEGVSQWGWNGNNL